MFGVRSEADAEQTKKTLPMLRELYRRERRVPVEMKIEIEEGGEKLTVTDADGNKAFAYGGCQSRSLPVRIPPKACSAALTKDRRHAFRGGRSGYHRGNGRRAVVHPGGAVNELRREALDALLKKREVLRPWPTTEEHVAALPPLRTLPPHRHPPRPVRAPGAGAGAALSGIEYLILPIAQADRVPREWRAKTLLSCPGSCLASWKRIPPAASRPRRTPVLQAMR